MSTDRHCRWTRPRLPLLAGGELGPDERRKVERHLIACPDCRGRRDASADALGALRLLAEEPPAMADPRPLWPALAVQIRQSRHAAPRASWWEPAFRPWGLVGLAAGLGALIVAATPPPWAGLEGALPDSSVAIPPGPVAEEADWATPPLVASAPARPGALPSGRPGSSGSGPLRPVEPPSSSLQFDYDLDHGTPMTPGNHDPQRAF